MDTGEIDYDADDDVGNDTDSGSDGTSNYQQQIVAELREIRSSLTSASGLFWVFVIVFVISGWSGSWADRWTDKLWYSVKYDTDFKNITVGKRPTDCDWLHAPLGDKDCHYQKATNVFGVEQRRQLASQATTQEEKHRYEEMPNAVNVYWEKKSE